MSPWQKTNNQFAETLHPVSVFTYFFVLTAMAMVYTNPVYLFAILAVVLYGISIRGALPAWRRGMYLGVSMTIVIMAINVFVSQNGQTILWTLPRLPIVGKIIITQEAILFGLNMGFKLCVILSIFCYYDTVMSADKSFSLFSRFTPKSAVALILTSLMVPQLKRRLSEIMVIMKTRGAKIDDKNLWTKIKSRFPLLKTILLSSLEDSWQTSEALYARGFGVGKRSHFTKSFWHKKDTYIFAFSIIMLVGFIISLLQTRGFLNFYPTVERIVAFKDIIPLTFILLGVMILPFLNRIQNNELV